jgi:hypothetical protein
MPRVRFEPTIHVFERAKTIHALDRAATVIGQITTLLSLKLNPWDETWRGAGGGGETQKHFRKKICDEVKKPGCPEYVSKPIKAVLRGSDDGSIYLGWHLGHNLFSSSSETTERHLLIWDRYKECIWSLDNEVNQLYLHMHIGSSLLHRCFGVWFDGFIFLFRLWSLHVYSHIFCCCELY